MATEQLTLRFNVDKNGQVSVDRLAGSMRKVDGATRKSNQSLGTMSSKLKTIGTTNLRQVAAGMGLAFGVQQLAAMAEAGRKANAIEQAFYQTNQAARSLLKTLRTSSLGILDDTFLQSVANRLQVIGLNGQQMAGVIDAGLRIAASTGKDAKAVIDSFTQALITQRSQSFQTLGLTIDKTRAEQAHAAAINKSRQAMTENERAIALANDVLAQAAKKFGDVSLEKFATDAKKAATEWDNLVSSIQQGASHIADSLAAAVMHPLDAVKEYFTIRPMSERYIAMIENTERAWSDLGGAVGETNRTSGEMSDSMRRLIAHMRDAKKPTDELTKSIEAQAAAALNAAENLQSMRAEQLRGVERYANIQEDIAELAAKGTLTAQEQVRLELLGLESDELSRQKGLLFEYYALQDKETKKLKTARLPAGALTIDRKTPTAGTTGSRAREQVPDFADIAGKAFEIAELQAQMMQGRSRLAEVSRLAALQADIQAEQEIANIERIAQARRDAKEPVDERGVARMVRQWHDWAQAKRDAAKASVEEFDATQQLRAEQNLQRLDAMLAAEQDRNLAQNRERIVAGIYEQAAAIRAVGEGMEQAASQASSLASALGGTGLDQRTMLLVQNLSAVAGSIGGIVDATTKGSKEMAGAAGNTLGAIGGMAAGLTGEIGKAAAVLAAFEVAAAVASAAYYDYRGAALHGAAAALYTGVAIAAGAGAFGGGRKGKGKRTVASLGTSTPSAAQSQGNVTYIVNMGDNNVYADDGPQVGLRLMEHLDAARFSV